jgi:hypothetical protein
MLVQHNCTTHTLSVVATARYGKKDSRQPSAAALGSTQPLLLLLLLLLSCSCC